MTTKTPTTPFSESLYPTPTIATLKPQYVGKQIKDVQPPAAILDAAVIRRNCHLMLDAVKKLDLRFRAHVKTHKTVEVAQLQVGEDSDSVRLICSTVAEIEHLLPWLHECKSKNKTLDVLYGLPISLSQIPRLGHITHQLGEGTIGLFVDHPSHIKALNKLDESVWLGQVPIWVNIDVGDHREGIAPHSSQLADIASALAASKRVRLVGLYSHLGASYNSNNPEEALNYMATELEGLREGAKSFLRSSGINERAKPNSAKVVLSLGATPTATSTQNLLSDTAGSRRYRELLKEINEVFAVELHAGVYPTLDMQQMATGARPREKASGLSYSDIGFRILAEVASLYPDRGEKPEALIAAGSIVLGREPCKSYRGWGVVTPWPTKAGNHYDPESSPKGWVVGRISQEHGVLVWEGPRDDFRTLDIGQKLLVWPNHACIAGVNFGFYLIVDSDTEDADQIRDVWIRCRGW